MFAVFVLPPVVQVAIAKAAIVPQLADLDAIQDHHVRMTGNKKRERYHLVVNADTLAELRELPADLLSGHLRVRQHVVQPLEVRYAVLALLAHFVEEVSAIGSQVVDRAGSRLA